MAQIQKHLQKMLQKKKKPKIQKKKLPDKTNKATLQKIHMTSMNASTKAQLKRIALEKQINGKTSGSHAINGYTIKWRTENDNLFMTFSNACRNCGEAMSNRAKPEYQFCSKPACRKASQKTYQEKHKKQKDKICLNCGKKFWGKYDFCHANAKCRKLYYAQVRQNMKNSAKLSK